jgi:hypothetical protein
MKLQNWGIHGYPRHPLPYASGRDQPRAGWQLEGGGREQPREQPIGSDVAGGVAGGMAGGRSLVSSRWSQIVGPSWSFNRVGSR